MNARRHCPDPRRVLRELFCLLCCDDDDRRAVAARIRISAGLYSITFTGDFDMQVPDSGGPFTAAISGFLDAKGNPAVDPGVAVWASSDDTIATVEQLPDPGDGTDSATVTLTGALGQAQISATYGDPAAGGFVVTGSLEVIAGPAISASMTFTGPGVTAPGSGGGPV